MVRFHTFESSMRLKMSIMLFDREVNSLEGSYSSSSGAVGRCGCYYLEQDDAV